MRQIERDRNQSIVINGHIRVTVLEVHEDEVTLSIESDRQPEMNRIETLRIAGSEAQELALVGSAS